MPTRAFNQIQATVETTNGTDSGAVPDALLGNLSVTPTVGLHQPTDTRKSLALLHRDTVVANGMTARFSGDANYEQIITWISMVMNRGDIAQQGSTTAYDFVYDPAINATRTFHSLTLEYGDDQQAFKSLFVCASSLELTYTMGSPVQLSVDMFGHPPQKQAFTGSPTEFTNPNLILSDGMKFYINDAWTDTPTEYASMLVGASIRIESGLTPVRYAEGLDSNDEIPFSAVVQNKRSHLMSLDFITTSDWEEKVYDTWLDRSNRVIVLDVTSAADAGLNEAYNFRVKMNGRFTGMGEFYGDHNGLNMVRAEFTSMDNLAATPRDLDIRVQNAETGYQ